MHSGSAHFVLPLLQPCVALLIFHCISLQTTIDFSCDYILQFIYERERATASYAWRSVLTHLMHFLMHPNKENNLLCVIRSTFTQFTLAVRWAAHPLLLRTRLRLAFVIRLRRSCPALEISNKAFAKRLHIIDKFVLLLYALCRRTPHSLGSPVERNDVACFFLLLLSRKVHNHPACSATEWNVNLWTCCIQRTHYTVEVPIYYRCWALTIKKVTLSYNAFNSSRYSCCKINGKYISLTEW